MPEGRSAALPELGAIHPRLPDALTRAPWMKPAPLLRGLAGARGGTAFGGFKFIRAVGSTGAAETGEDPAPEPPRASERHPLFFWYFFPLPGNLAAWEATTGTGRATYFFRRRRPGQAVAQITRGLALVNFRREPIYLPDDSLEQQPRYHRYAIGARKLPDLRALRAAYQGERFILARRMAKSGRSIH